MQSEIIGLNARVPSRIDPTLFINPTDTDDVIQQKFTTILEKVGRDRLEN